MQSPEDKALELVLAIQEALATPGANVVVIARRFLDERAALERERCARIVGDWAAVPGSDLDDCAAAIRNLPPDHTQREPRDTR